MKKYMASYVLGTLVLLFSFHQTTAQDESWDDETEVDYSSQSTRKVKPLFGSVDGLIAIPVGPLKEHAKVRGGFRFALGKPFKANPSMSVGLEVGGIFSGSKNDKFKGLDVTTSTTLLSLQPIIRWVPKNNSPVCPFFDFSIGIMVASTETTSEIVDEPTFLEKVLLGEETEVEITAHQIGGSTNFSYGIAAGVIIKKFIMVGVRYQHANPVDYINTDKVTVNDGAIQYEVNRIPLDMIVITLGIGIWKMPN